MKLNKRRRENHAAIPLTPNLVRTLLLSRHLQSNDESDHYTRISFEGGSFGGAEEDEADDDNDHDDDHEDDDDDSSEDGDPRNPRECVIS